MLLLIFAAALQCVFANSVGIRGGRPDFVLTVALLASQFFGANEGAGTGCFAGLLTAACASPPPHLGGYGSTIVSRTITCFVIGWLEERIFRENIMIATATVAVGTIATELLFFAFDPHFRVLLWMRGVGLEVVYNSAIAVPLYFIVRRLLKPAKASATI